MNSYCYLHHAYGLLHHSDGNHMNSYGVLPHSDGRHMHS